MIKLNFFSKRINVISVLGMSVGISCTLIVFLIIKYELTFDAHNSKRVNIFRIVSKEKVGEHFLFKSHVPYPLANVLKNEASSVMATTQVLIREYGVIKFKTPEGEYKKIEESEITYTDKFYTDVFDLVFIAGGSNKFLESPYDVILTTKEVEKLFGQVESLNSLIGQEIVINESPLIISGIVKSTPRNTNLPFHVLANLQSIEFKRPDILRDWSGNFRIDTYILTDRGTMPKNVIADLDKLKKKYIEPEHAKNIEYELQPLSSIHSDKVYRQSSYYSSPAILIYALIVLAVFILISASINYISLSVSDVLKKAKQIGIRKMLGASNQIILNKYFLESLALMITAAIIGVLSTYLLLPSVNGLVKFFDLGLEINGSIIFPLILLIILITLLAGYFPASALLSISPLRIVSKNVRFSKKITFRSAMVGIQFGISQFLIISAFIIFDQLKFIKGSDLGYQTDHKILVFLNDDSEQKQIEYRYNLSKIQNVEDVSFNSGPPTSSVTRSDFFYDISKGDENKIKTEIKEIDNHYFDLFGLKLVAGGNMTLSDKIESQDSTNRIINLIVNQKAVRELGIEADRDAIGKTIVFGLGKGVIKGVVADFRNQSLQQDVKPVLFIFAQTNSQWAIVKTSSNASPSIIEDIKNAFNEIYPERVFKYYFLEDYLEMFYVVEDILFKILKFLLILSLAISGFGMYALTSYVFVDRLKEISIRKVMGASSSEVAYLFFKKYTKNVILSFFIAFTLSYLLMNPWLSSFSSKIQIGGGHVFLPLIISIFIAWCAIAYKIITACFVNPIKNLRVE